ncbi:MAG: cysteine--tRNA ligase [Dehalococcoidales bacterium]|nr:cysteine--tRNA ligase [Dehalococcoidales bacterium]
MQVFNSLSGKKEEFIPWGDEVKMYVCGINPYDDAHIGHALSYIFFDVVRRYLEYRGYKVRHVQNITDIEDNIIAHANERGVTVQELTQKYVERYDEDMAALNILPAHVYPRAMGEIDKMLEIVSALVEKGYAYAVGGNVYFRVRQVPDYGKLSHRDPEQMLAGTRIEVGEDKEDQMDFLLWKEAKPGEPSWDSPWGKGRPGWHIECSAMSIKYLGEQIDIHGGGQDVVFPHHENEIAQSESFTGKKPFSKYWIHNGLLSISGEKGSRSLGNMITIREALKTYSADAIRVFVLGSYYRSPLSFLSDSLENGEKGADRLRLAALAESKGDKTPEIDAGSYRDRFIEAMDDDFGTSQALATLFDMARDINRLSAESCDISGLKDVYLELAGVLGLTLKAVEEKADASVITPVYTEICSEIGRTPVSETDNADAMLQDLIEARQQHRKAKEWSQADLIRNKLDEAGILLEDSARGTTWKLKK